MTGTEYRGENALRGISAFEAADAGPAAGESE